jgi:hypothetical protein
MALPVAPKDDRAERKQIELLRAAGPGRRAALMRGVTTSVIEMARRAIARAQPGISERDVDLRFVELHYGRDLADKLRRYLEGR